MENNIEEILNGVDNIKISIVMQSNLSNYPGSRTEAINKFRRAVNSFQNQLYKNAELIIVADGCSKTQQIYNREFANDPSIRFAYIDKNGANNTYEQVDGGKYYRGYPRRIGVAMAAGTIITYMDSDDILMPEFTITCMLIYNTDPSLDWWINNTWYDSSEHTWEDSTIMYESNHDNSIEVEGVDGRWTATQLKPGMIVLSPWLFMHKADCTTKWRDTIGGSEDVDFSKRLRADYPKGTSYSRPTYVRCHYGDLWDF